jgi:hypothetical protein
MDRARVAEWRELVESTEDPVDRAELASRIPPVLRRSPTSLLERFGNRETWRRILAAHIQLPDAAD